MRGAPLVGGEACVVNVEAFVDFRGIQVAFSVCEGDVRRPAKLLAKRLLRLLDERAHCQLRIIGALLLRGLAVAIG